MSEKLVIGLVGEKGAGKSTFSELLTQVIHPKTLYPVSTGEFIAEELEHWGI